MKSNVIGKGVRRQAVGGMTLVEVMVSVALGSLLLAMASSLWLFGSRSFVAMSNYSDLGAKSRHALDFMSREIRQATRVTGFDNTALDSSFFPDGKWRSSILCAIGYGEREKLHPRGPRLGFDEACRIV